MKKTSFLFPGLMYDKETFMLSISAIADPIRKVTTIGGEGMTRRFTRQPPDLYSCL
jgi:hypothetical protein